MKNLSFLLLSLLISQIIFPQEILNQFLTDSTKPVQYRRGVELQHGYQSYEEKYAGKNLNDEKRRLFPLRSTGVWTELNPKVPRVDYLGVHFVNKDTGWACGNLGAIIKTTNGGSSWTVSETNTTTPILKVRSYNGQIVIASGYAGKILRSSDGGETFTQGTSNVTGDLWGLQMINDTLGWACGNVNSLTKTTDGGLTWQRVLTPGYTLDYWWIDFMNKDYGFIAANGKVLRTTDGGNNWNLIQVGDSAPLFCIDLIDSLHLATAGYGGLNYSAKNYYSSDGGNNWIQGDTLNDESVNCIQFVNDDTGYLTINEAGIYKTTNRGQDWTPLNLTGGGIPGLFELQFLKNINLGYAAGIGLRIYRALNNLDAWNKLIINDNFVDVYFTSETTGFAAANRIIYKTTNAGSNWLLLPNFPSNVFTASLNSLTFTNDVTGFAGGYPCRIVKTTDAGDNWYVVNRTGLADTIGTINKIFFINQTTGWAVTSRGGILKTTDGGENWFSQLNAGVSVIFFSIHFVDSLYGWTANSDRPFKTTNGGINWIQQTNLDIWQSRAIYFRDSLNGFIINGIFELLRTTNSGVNWFTQLNVQYVIRNFGWLSPSHCFIIGDGIYETNDSGNNWNEIFELRNFGLSKFYAPTNYNGYCIGNLGLIYQYIDTSIIPVELTSFSVEANNNTIQLKWTTKTETNNQGFEVLRSDDKLNWKVIEFINGNGTTTMRNDYQYIDKVEIAGSYYYQLKQIDYNGVSNYSNIIIAFIGRPIGFELSQTFPNPFNSSTTIGYQLPTADFVSLKVYNVLGKEVKTLIEENKNAGYYSVLLNAANLSSGIYFYKLRAGKGNLTKKFILLK